MTTESMISGGAGEPLRRIDTDLGSGGLAASGSSATSGGSSGGSGSGAESDPTKPSKPSKPSKPQGGGRRQRRKWLRYFVVAVLLALVAALASAGSVYWEFSKIPTFKMPKDQGVEAGSIRPPSAFPGVDPADPAAVDPGASDPGASDPSDGSGPETVEGLPSATPSADAPNAPGTNRPSGADVANTKQNVVDRADIGPDGYFGDANTKNYLIVGLDDRTGITAEQAVEFGKDKPETAGSRTDTILVLRIDAKGGRAWLMSFPRDLWITVPGTTTKARINSIYARGQDQLITAIRENFGMPIDHGAVINFAGFQKIVDTIGGVPICFAKPSRDLLSGLKQPAGCNLLTGKQATRFVRSRHFQTQDANGKWVTDPSSDFGRIARQQTFIREVLAQARKRGFTNPFRLRSTVKSLQSAVVIDDQLGPSEILRLANDMRAFDPAELKPYTVLARGERIEGKEVLVATDKAAEILRLFGNRPIIKP
jgi:LCP family protein required for cell wall assembly